ncbi:hypothetical protein [Saccharothrix yanglingensis]|uniref:hypothetical protein n=1 Tax=Saccharothrix yanglingensis TaxID=659496 RepID=UPI0027D316E9|nr:hypothetical protein [Saccharothrix yanglingensis]
MGKSALHRRRSVERGEPPAGLGLEPDHLDRLAEHPLGALGARQPGDGTAK